MHLDFGFPHGSQIFIKFLAVISPQFAVKFPCVLYHGVQDAPLLPEIPRRRFRSARRVPKNPFKRDAQG